MPAKPQLASTGAAIDAALDDDTNALREQAKKDSDANFAAEEADHKARGQQLRNIKGALARARARPQRAIPPHLPRLVPFTPSRPPCMAPPESPTPAPASPCPRFAPLNSPTTTPRGHGLENRSPAQLRA